MADEVARRMKEEEERKNPVGVAECLVDDSLRMHPVGLTRGRVDNEQAISSTLARDVLPKALPLELFFPVAELNIDIPGYGQGGFIRRGVLQRSPGESVQRYSVVPITAKHNLRQVQIRQTFRSPVTAKLNVPSFDVRVPVSSPDIGWLPTPDDGIHLRPDSEGRPAIGPWGFDVSIGGLIDHSESPLTLPLSSFSLVREKFTLEKGQKVGIAVLFCEKAKPTKETIAGASSPNYDTLGISEDDIKAIYGEPGYVNIYTGEITYVGESHIEYSFNSFTGCSGAVVFLLDKDQPASVQQCDYGHAVAIHSGAHPFLSSRNYGFAIRSHPDFN